MIPPVDWAALAAEVGSVPVPMRGGGTSTSTGTRYACAALERLIGQENIRAAVDLIMDWREGWPLTMSVLQHIRSREATEFAYARYITSTGEAAIRAVWIIKEIAHPVAADWVEQFLADPVVAQVGVGVLDQLVFTNALDTEDERCEFLLQTAEAHPEERVRRVAGWVRETVTQWREKQ